MPVDLSTLWGPDGPFVDEPATRSALEGLEMGTTTIVVFVDAVTDLTWMEITGRGGTEEFERATVGDRWRAVEG